MALPAQADDTLERLRQQKKINVAVPDNPPYSGLTSDGQVTGLAPTLCKAILGHLGVPEVQGIVVPYGQLIPGLQAGRWDLIAACMTITKERCRAVAYADPIVSEGGCFIYIPDDLPNPPRSVAEIGTMGLTVVTGQGAYTVQRAMSLGVPASKIVQSPDIAANLSMLETKRVQISYDTYYGALTELKQRPSKFKLIYTLPDDLPRGSAPAFRVADTAFRDVFQSELRAMKKSGEFQKMADSFGFPPVGQMIDVTAEQECARVS
jgi:polar amino acid transport system substrate-binding protein